MEQPDIQSADLQIGKHREPGGAVHPQRRARDQKTFLQSLFFRPGGDITQEQGQAVARIVLETHREMALDLLIADLCA